MPPRLAQQCNPAMSPDSQKAPVTLENISGEKKNGNNNNNKIKAEGEKEGTKMNHMLDVVSY